MGKSGDRRLIIYSRNLQYLRTLIAGNFAGEGGGSIGADALANIANTTFSNNTSTDEASALYVGKGEFVYPPGEVYLVSSTVTNNESNIDGVFGNPKSTSQIFKGKKDYKKQIDTPEIIYV